MKKEIVTIEDLTVEGQGVGRIDGQVVFVEGALPGDTVRVRITGKRKRLLFAEREELLEPSAHRVAPLCPWYRACGNCMYMELSYEKECQIKAMQIRNALERIGKVKVENISFLPAKKIAGYRNKVEWKVQKGKTGYYRRGTHRFVPVEHCMLLDEKLNEATSFLQDLIQNSPEVEEIRLQVGEQDRLMAVLFQKENKEISHVLPSSWRVYRVAEKNTFPVTAEKPFYRRVGDRLYALSPHSFFQVNQEQTKRLFDLIQEKAALQEGEDFLELYCGVGAISIYLAQKGIRIRGAEVLEEAVEKAKENAALNGVKGEYLAENAECIYRQAKVPDVLLVDPPRRGLERSLVEDILERPAKRMLYVSCNPASLARDMQRLQKVYEVVSITGVDMFPRTGHCECVVLMQNKEEE